jgi:hypothetical protein
MSYLVPLSSISPPDLISFDRDSAVAEIIERIQSNPEWNNIWDGELLQNFSYFIINTFSYLFEKNAEAANRLLRETFITQSKDPLSVINYLSNYSLNLQQNIASEVDIVVRKNDGSSFTKPWTLPPGFRVSASTFAGSGTFEIYNKNTEGKIEYRLPIEIAASNYTTVRAYHGTTKKVTIQLDPLTQREKFIYKLTDTGIIENSIRIFWNENQVSETELPETDSFIVPVKTSIYFPNEVGGVPHYKILYNSDGSASILFGTSRFGGSFTSEGGILTFYYRVGGGSNTGVPRGGINFNTELQIDNYTSATINFYNLIAGGGGGDIEDINEARYYAPHRVGRGRSIVNDIDALNVLNNSVIKHKVKSPMYNTYSVPVLHYYNYIVPNRNWSNFRFPTVSTSDDINIYKNKFEAVLNDFLNLQGIHDGAENNILISYFKNYDFSFIMPYKPILNSSLSVSAFNEDGKEIDRLVWSGNYNAVSQHFPDLPIISAIIKTPGIVPSLGISSNYNSFKFKIDNPTDEIIIPPNSNINNVDYFTTSIPIGTYTVNSQNFNINLANAIDTAIRESDSYYASFPSSVKFCEIDSEGKINLKSLTTGRNSSVKIIVESNSLFSILGLISQKVYAEPQNRTVFKNTSIYDSSKQEVFLKTNFSDWTITKLKTNLVPIWSDPTNKTGPTISFILTDDEGKLIKIRSGSAFTIEAIHNSIVVDTLTYNSVTDTIVYGSTNDNLIFDDSSATINYFDNLTGTIAFKLKDSNRADDEHNYPLDEETLTEIYNDQTIFRLTYEKKQFKFITVSCIPNPYVSEGEALTYHNNLKMSQRKMIGIEPLLKKVNFIPFGIEVVIKVATSYTRQEAIRETLDVIYNNFGYDTMGSSYSIGTGLFQSNLLSTLSGQIKSIKSIRFNYPSVDITDTNEDSYFFLLPTYMIASIENLEKNNTNITGLSLRYAVRVIIE